MLDEMNVTETEKPAARRGRRFAAAATVAALVGASTVLAASSASADTIVTHCAVYHSWTECLSYDYSNGTYGLAATNGYSVSEYETLWFTVGGTQYSDTLTIPSGATRGFGASAPAGYACEGIDNVTFYCWQY
jgi:hypothetical protein